MKICVSVADQSFSGAKSLGIYNVSLGIIRGLLQCDRVEELFVLTTPESAIDSDLMGVSPGKLHIVKTGCFAPRRAKRIIWDQSSVITEFNKIGCEWLLLPKGFPPLLRWPRGKVCCYVHDDIQSFYRSMGWRHFPLLETMYFRASLRKAIDFSDLIVTNSNFTLSEVKRLGRKRNAARVGIGFRSGLLDQTKSSSTNDKGILILLSSLPHKLTGQAIDWIDRWKKERGSNLTVYGVGSLPESLEFPRDCDWKRFERLPAYEFEALWSKVCLLAYFSAYEGYGMPPLESLERGIPCVASDIAPHRENISKRFLFSNESYESFASTLDFALTSRVTEEDRSEIEDWSVVTEKIVARMMEIP